MQELWETADGILPNCVAAYPQIRFMGSKQRLLPWIYAVLSDLRFATVLDAFSGSGCVSYLLKAMGKTVASNDFLNFSIVIARALIENQKTTLSQRTIDLLLRYDPHHRHFIENTYTDIFFTAEDLRFMDRVWWNIDKHLDPYERSLALAALIRSAAKRQPRGVFTVAGDPEKYKDGRRDLQLSIKEHFLEQVHVYNEAVFNNARPNRVVCSDVFDLAIGTPDLVYMDPPYVPRSDDNCYIKRYHFLEGLSCYWRDQDLMEDTKVKKIEKRYTPFSYRREAIDAFDRLFRKFRQSTLVLSYSSNGFPDLDVLLDLMQRYKDSVKVHTRHHRYHFGTHDRANRNDVEEYLVIGV